MQVKDCNCLFPYITSNFLKVVNGLAIFNFVLGSITLCPHFALAQQKNRPDLHLLRGKVFDSANGEVLTGANVYVTALKTGATTNIVGEYYLRVPSGKHELRISSVGYKPIILELSIHRDTLITHKLEQSLDALEEIIITAEADSISSLRLGQNTLNLATLRKMPPLLGEPDLIRGLLLMPGVSTVGEGATGFNVRGGSVDQNLVLLDDAPVFNTSHLFGFLTAFNANAITNANLYKAGIPASYGGRVASVLDVRLKQGNTNRLEGEAGIGLMAATAILEGPIVKGRTTFLFSGRTSYSDWLLNTVPEEQIANSDASFHDATLKVSHQINANHMLSFTGYTSYDKFKFPGDTSYAWRTTNLTLKLGSTLNPKLFLMSTLVSSQYQYMVSGRELTNEFDWRAHVKYRHVKEDLTISINKKNTGETGVGVEFYRVSLGSLAPHNDSNVNSFSQSEERGSIGYAYYSHQYEATSRLMIRAGIRFSGYVLTGPGTVNNYEENKPKSNSTFINSTVYDNRKTIKTYYAFEPRLLFRYTINRTSSIKVSADQTAQYLHLLSNTSAISPVDLWKLSDPYLKPQIGRQLSIGYFKSVSEGRLSFSLEAFYKLTKNVVDYKDGAELLLNDRLEAGLLQGRARSYGAECMIEKKLGKFTGWVSYTLSRTERLIAGQYPEETVNKGNYYPANFDKPHNVSFTGNFQKNKRLSWGFNFVYASGRPVTYPTSSYGYGGMRVVNYEYRNNERSPSYHRLDLSATIKSKPKPGRKWTSTWIISVYNVYARKNPYSIFFRSEQNVLAQSYRLAVIGTVVPSISYTIHF
ncbi:MAG TPA: TonB-dependent receptor [Chryseolinea sp.]